MRESYVMLLLPLLQNANSVALIMLFISIAASLIIELEGHIYTASTKVRIGLKGGAF